MSETETHTVETVYGPAEIETYECDSCGNTVAYENTVEFAIGEDSGRACSHCEETGPVSFPARTVEWSFELFQGTEDKFGVFGLIALFPLLAPLSIGLALTGEASEIAHGIAQGIIAFSVWLGAFLVLWVYL